MIKQSLSKVSVFLGKTKKGTHQREGWRNEDGLVFLPPANGKRGKAWATMMQERGYTFA